MDGSPEGGLTPGGGRAQGTSVGDDIFAETLLSKRLRSTPAHRHTYVVFVVPPVDTISTKYLVEP